MCDFIKDTIKGIGISFFIIVVLCWIYCAAKKETNRKDD